MLPDKTKLIQTSTGLLIVDVQVGLNEAAYYGGNRNNSHAEQNMMLLLAKWRQLKLPVFHVQHASTNPKSPLFKSKPGFAIKAEVQPLEGEPIFEKNVNSGFIGTNLEAHLLQKGIRKLVIIGLTTNHCISTTARMAANLGFETVVVSDATATFDSIGANGVKYDAETVHQVSLASLKNEFALILETQTILKMQ